jgi:Zn-dependent protease
MITVSIEQLVVIFSVIFISMTIHELMHGLVAYWLGDDTAKLQGRLTLNPIKHIDPFLTILLPLMLAILGGPIFGGAKPVPFRPDKVRYGDWGAALVALAGPFTNLVIAFVFYGVSVVTGVGLNADGSMNIIGMIFSYGIMVNLGFFVFNMIPFPPLDGSRFLYALAPEFARRGMEALEQYGIFVVFAIVYLANGAISAYMQGAMSAILDIFQRIFI